MNVLSRRVVGRYSIVVALVAGLLAAMMPASAANAASAYSITGVVSLPAGVPAAWLQAIEVQAFANGVPGPPVASVKVDPGSGDYVLAGMAPGTYQIKFEVYSYPDPVNPGSIRPNLVPEYFDGGASVVINGADLAGIDASLVKGGTISGVVALPAGAPATWLQAVDVNVILGGGHGGAADVDPTTGAYTITGLAPGAYTVQFSSGPFWDDTAHTIVSPNLANEFYSATTGNAYINTSASVLNVATGTTTGISETLEYSRTVAGTVTLPVGAPAVWMQGVTVQVWDGQAMLASTNPDPVTGTYELTGVPAGKHVVAFSVDLFMDMESWTAVSPRLHTQYYKSTTDINAATEVNLIGLNATGIDALMTLKPADPFDTAPAPKITGTLGVGNSVTASVGTWSPTPDSFAYQWFLDGVKISGAVSSQYMLTASDAGHQVSVMVTAKKFGYTTAMKASPRVSVPLPVFAVAPAPAITGTATVGNKVTVSLGSWSPKPDSMSYQWFRDGVKIPGAVSYQYTLTASDAGHQVSVMATATKAGYKSVGKASARVSVPLQTFTTAPTPTIAGTAMAGNKVTVSLGWWSPKPDSVTYQWFRDGVKISGAVNYQYTLTAADSGYQVSVMVTAKKAGFASVSKASARLNIAS